MTTKMTHTPGPWKVVDPADRHKQADIMGNGFHIAEVVEDPMQGQANAHLIAAGPAMYEALDWIIYEIDKGTHDLSDIRRVAQEAKARAEGRTP